MSIESRRSDCIGASVDDLSMIDKFLRAQNILTMATVSDDGVAYASLLFYVVDDNRQSYWLSSGSSVHSLHVVTGVNAIILEPCLPVKIAAERAR